MTSITYTHSVVWSAGARTDEATRRRPSSRSHDRVPFVCRRFVDPQVVQAREHPAAQAALDAGQYLGAH